MPGKASSKRFTRQDPGTICQKLRSVPLSLPLTCHREGSATYAGVLLADLGISVFPLGGWDPLKTDMRILIYVGGSLIFLGGLFLICIDKIGLMALRHQSSLKYQGRFLGDFHLNGYAFEAYERAGNNSEKEFRLVASPSVSPAQEAAVIRYIIHEGLIEDLLPQMSKEIEGEASWAFLS